MPTPVVRPLLLVVDDEPAVLRMIERLASEVGYDVATYGSGVEALKALARKPADLAMLDLRMPDVNGLELLRQIRTALPSCEVVLMTGHAAIDSAIEAIKLGARDYLVKPFEIDRLQETLVAIRDDIKRRAHVTALESQVARQLEFCGMLGRSPRMLEVFSLIRRFAPHAKGVLINGETGTGKELAARAFHQLGARRSGPFVTINCAAVVDTLFESELFGHVRGAFTGATESKLGLFEAAHRGTLFLDEIGETPLSVQPKLLRTLELGEVHRVGSLQPRQVDVAVIAATNRDLAAEVAAGRFREDLFYRLNIVEVSLPPLRERPEDIPFLTAVFMREAARRIGKPLSGLTPAAERLLLNASWPGNVRQLKNTIERACMMADGTLIGERDLGSLVPVAPGFRPGRVPPTARDQAEREHISEVLLQVGGNHTAAAKVLGLSRRSLYRRLRRYGLDAAPPSH